MLNDVSYDVDNGVFEQKMQEVKSISSTGGSDSIRSLSKNAVRTESVEKISNSEVPVDLKVPNSPVICSNVNSLPHPPTRNAAHERSDVQRQAWLDAQVHARVHGHVLMDVERQRAYGGGRTFEQQLRGVPMSVTAVPVPKRAGKWSADEHQLFLEGLSTFGKDWKRIANQVQTRTLTQIRTHAQKYFLKLEKLRSLGLEGESVLHQRMKARPKSKTKTRSPRTQKTPKKTKTPKKGRGSKGKVSKSMFEFDRDRLRREIFCWEDHMKSSSMSGYIIRNSFMTPPLEVSSTSSSARASSSHYGGYMWPTMEDAEFKMDYYTYSYRDNYNSPLSLSRSSSAAKFSSNLRSNSPASFSPHLEPLTDGGLPVVDSDRSVQFDEEESSLFKKVTDATDEREGFDNLTAAATAAMEMLGMSINIPLCDLECNTTIDVDDNNDMEANNVECKNLECNTIDMEKDHNSECKKSFSEEKNEIFPITTTTTTKEKRTLVENFRKERGEEEGERHDGNQVSDRKRKRKSFVDECIEKLMQQARAQGELIEIDQINEIGWNRYFHYNRPSAPPFVSPLHDQRSPTSFNNNSGKASSWMKEIQQQFDKIAQKRAKMGGDVIELQWPPSCKNAWEGEGDCDPSMEGLPASFRESVRQACGMYYNGVN
eukprot:g3820.t1